MVSLNMLAELYVMNAMPEKKRTALTVFSALNAIHMSTKASNLSINQRCITPTILLVHHVDLSSVLMLEKRTETSTVSAVSIKWESQFVALVVDLLRSE